MNRNAGAAAADNARVKQEFLLRKQEAAANRAKAHGGFMANNVISVSGIISDCSINSSASFISCTFIYDFYNKIKCLKKLFFSI